MEPDHNNNSHPPEDRWRDQFEGMPGERLIRFLFRPWVFRILITLVVIYIFLVVGWALNLGRKTADFGVLVWAQREWVSGGTAGVRVTVEEPDLARFTGNFHGELRLLPMDREYAESPKPGSPPATLAELSQWEDGSDGEILLLSRESPLTGLSATIQVPSLPPGPALLEVTARQGKFTERAQIPIQIIDRPKQGDGSAPPRLVDMGASPPRDTTKPQVVQGKTGTVQFRIVPDGGQLIPSLPGSLILRAVDPQGKGVPGKVNIQLLRGRSTPTVPPFIELDQCGLGSFPVTLESNDLLLRLSMPGNSGHEPARAEEHVDLSVKGNPVRMVARTSTPFPPRGEPTPIHMETLQSTVELHGDIYHDRIWSGTEGTRSTGGLASLTLPADRAPSSGLVGLTQTPAGVTGPFLVQVYTGFAAPGKARITRWLWPLEDLASAPFSKQMEAMVHTLTSPRSGWITESRGSKGDTFRLNKHLEGCFHSEEQARLTAQYLLSQVDQPPYDPPLLLRSGDLQKKELARNRERGMGKVKIALGALGGTIILILFLLLLSSNAQLKRRYALSDHLEEYTTISRQKVMGKFIMLLLAILLIFIAMIIMLDNLQWGL